MGGYYIIMKFKTTIGSVVCVAIGIALFTGCGKKQAPLTIFATDTVESYSLPMKSDFSRQYNTALG